MKIRTKYFTPPTGEGFGIELIVSVIKLCSIYLHTFHKGSDGIVSFALDGNPLDIQQLDLIMNCLGGIGVLNQLENAVATELLLHGEEGFGTCVHGLEEYVT